VLRFFAIEAEALKHPMKRSGQRSFMNIVQFCSPHSIDSEGSLLPNLQQDTRSIQQADLLRWLVKTDIRLVACAAMDMRKSESNENGDTTSREAVSPVSDDETIDGGDGAHELSTKRPPHVMYDEGVVVEANTAGLGSTMPPHSEEFLPLGELSQKFAADALPECQLLSSLTQR